MRINALVLVPVLAMSSLAVLTLPVLAEPIACKGLAEQACKANPGCTFVKGYATMGGTTTKDYCRRSMKKAK